MTVILAKNRRRFKEREGEGNPLYGLYRKVHQGHLLIEQQFVFLLAMKAVTFVLLSA